MFVMCVIASVDMQLSIYNVEIMFEFESYFYDSLGPVM